MEKIIHYCWFGNNKKNKLIKKCIRSWNKHAKEYQIIEWNEKKFSIDKAPQYVQDAYKYKKYAFVTDYVRLYALYNYGGIYVDTDVEFIKQIDFLLQYKGVSGFQTQNSISTGMIAAEKGLSIIKELLDEYDDRPFIINGNMNLTTNVKYITSLFLKKGLKLNNQFQTIEDFTFFPMDYFCAKNYLNGKYEITKNTIMIHHFNGSWLTSKEKFIIKFPKLTKFFVKIKKGFRK